MIFNAETRSMKFVPFLISSAITILLIIVFNTRWGPAPPFGEFLSPQHGFWQNAEPVDKDFGQDLQLPGLKDPAEIYLDDRLVPHVFAGNEDDAYFISGLSPREIPSLADGIPDICCCRPHQRTDRTKGLKLMTGKKEGWEWCYAAEKAVAEIEKNPVSKAEADAYTAGVNAYITKPERK